MDNPEPDGRPRRAGHGSGGDRFFRGLLVAAVVVTLARFTILGGPEQGPEAGPAAESPAVQADQAYRLRVRGLHPLVRPEGAAPARVEIGARMVGDGTGRVVVDARLMDEHSGEVLWEREYPDTGASPDEIRKVVAEALRDAMRLTREGAGGEGQRI